MSELYKVEYLVPNEAWHEDLWYHRRKLLKETWSMTMSKRNRERKIAELIIHAPEVADEL